MTWDKKKYSLKIKGGCGQIVTAPLWGYVQQFVISPESFDTVWSMRIVDRDDDIIYQVIDHEGMLNDRMGLPVGKDKPESLRFQFNGFTRNELISVLLNTKEK